jgi:hypothetical protein
MPNWCDNSVTLRHPDKAKIDALAAEMSKKNDNGGSMACPFQHLRPNPTGEWQYDWSVENWGTKWEASIIDWDHSGDNEIRLYYETAWSPPIALYEYLVEEGWEVEAIYHECGMCYIGQFTTEDGDDYYEYDITIPEDIERLPEDLIEFADLRTRAEEWQVEQLEELWGDAERTDWIPATKETSPVRDGYYEVTTKGWDFPQFVKWDRDHWVAYNEVVQWRGLAEEPNETKVD